MNVEVAKYVGAWSRQYFLKVNYKPGFKFPKDSGNDTL
jgi:hypothetical protein